MFAFGARSHARVRRGFGCFVLLLLSRRRRRRARGGLHRRVSRVRRHEPRLEPGRRRRRRRGRPRRQRGGLGRIGRRLRRLRGGFGRRLRAARVVLFRVLFRAAERVVAERVRRAAPVVVPLNLTRFAVLRRAFETASGILPGPSSSATSGRFPLGGHRSHPAREFGRGGLRPRAFELVQVEPLFPERAEDGVAVVERGVRGARRVREPRERPAHLRRARLERGGDGRRRPRRSRRTRTRGGANDAAGRPAERRPLARRPRAALLGRESRPGRCGRRRPSRRRRRRRRRRNPCRARGPREAGRERGRRRGGRPESIPPRRRLGGGGRSPRGGSGRRAREAPPERRRPGRRGTRNLPRRRGG